MVKFHWTINCFVDFWLDPRHFILGGRGVIRFYCFGIFMFLHAQLGLQMNNICNGLFLFYVNCSVFVFVVADFYYLLFFFFFFLHLSSRYV